MDDESVVEFYEGFARLAFGDSRGSVMGRGKLLKYRTKEEMVVQNLKEEAAIGGGSGGHGEDTNIGDTQEQPNLQQQQHSQPPSGSKVTNSGCQEGNES